MDDRKIFVVGSPEDVPLITEMVVVIEEPKPNAFAQHLKELTYELPPIELLPLSPKKKRNEKTIRKTVLPASPQTRSQVRYFNKT